MPKKTKAQKIIAQLRRKLVAKEARKIVFKEERREKKSPPVLTEPKPQSQEASVSFVLGDLKKSLFLTALAISLEFVLYYLLELGGVSQLSPLINRIVSLVKKG